MGFKDRFVDIVDTAAGLIRDVFLRKIDDRYIAFNNALNIYGINEDERCVYVDYNKSESLYCIEIAGKENIPKTFSIFSKIAHNYSEEEGAKCVLVFSKNRMIIDGREDNFAAKESIYLFGFSRAIMEEFSHVSELKLKKPKGIISALFDVGLINTYYNNEETMELESMIESVSEYAEDEINYTFKTIFSEGVYKALSEVSNIKTDNGNERRFSMFQGYEFSSKFSITDEEREDDVFEKPNITEMFVSDWYGYVAIILDFNTTRTKISYKSWRSAAKSYETDAEVRKNTISFDKTVIAGASGEYGVGNIVAVIDNPSAIVKISKAMNVNFTPKNIFVKDILYHTPIMRRDVSFDFPMRISDFSRYIKSIHKRRFEETAQGNDTYGKDISGNYITFSFSESRPPHASIVAGSRSGKTFMIQKTIFSSIGAKIVKNPNYEIENETHHVDTSILESDNVEDSITAGVPKAIIEGFSKLGKTRVVHFDIGYSGIKAITEAQKCAPDQVLFFKDDIEKLRFGLTDIRWNNREGKPSEEDLFFSIYIIGILLEQNGAVPLDGNEQAQFVSAFSYLWKHRDTEYEGYSLKRLKELGGYEDVLRQIYKTYGNIDPLTKTTSLPDVDKKFPFLAKPLIKDIIEHLTQKSNHTSTKESERLVIDSTIMKLRSITGSPIFSYYSKAHFKDAHYFYMELETIKALGEKLFIPVFTLIMQKMYRRDVLRAQKYKLNGRTPPKIIYILEEYHNFKTPSLDKIFDKMFREAARYNITLILITQNGRDIDKNVLKNIGTRIVMPSDKVEEQIEELPYYWGTSDDGEMADKIKKHISYFEKNNQKYMAFMKYGGGLMTLKQYISPEEAWLFDSNPPKKKIEKTRMDEE